VGILGNKGIHEPFIGPEGRNDKIVSDWKKMIKMNCNTNNKEIVTTSYLRTTPQLVGHKIVAMATPVA